MNKKFSLLIISAFISFHLYSQAGYGIYQFLDLPVSSRLAGFGGSNVSLYDHDLNFAFLNPASLSAENDNMIGLNMANYLADIKFGTAIFGKTINEKNYMAFGVQYVDYGIFKETNEIDQVLGEFTAKDIAFNVVYARPITDRFSIGAIAKPIFSIYERYTSFGLAADAGINYHNKESLFSAGLVFRNIGRQLKGYYVDESGQHIEPLAFNVLMGITQKLRHAPLRFSITAHNLQQWDLSYQKTNQPKQQLINTGDEKEKKIGFGDMLFRHAIIGVEFVPSNNFYVMAGYNHRRRQEMKMPGFKSLAGFSFGAGIKIYKFQVGFGMTQFQKGNYSYQFSIATSLKEFGL